MNQFGLIGDGLVDLVLALKYLASVFYGCLIHGVDFNAFAEPLNVMMGLFLHGQIYFQSKFELSYLSNKI